MCMQHVRQEIRLQVRQAWGRRRGVADQPQSAPAHAQVSPAHAQVSEQRQGPVRRQRQQLLGAAVPQLCTAQPQSQRSGVQPSQQGAMISCAGSEKARHPPSGEAACTLAHVSSHSACVMEASRQQLVRSMLRLRPSWQWSHQSLGRTPPVRTVTTTCRAQTQEVRTCTAAMNCSKSWWSLLSTTSAQIGGTDASRSSSCPQLH